MALEALSQRHAAGRQWNAWTLMAILLMVSNFWIPASNAASLPRRNLKARASIANGLDLRILPIGDSITYGAPDEPYNSYRASLYNKLTNGGNSVDYVGVMESGTLADRQHEGHRGELINGISSLSSVGIYAAPNLVLLHAGTNDMKEDVNVLSAPTRLKALINYIFQHSEDAVVLVAQIIPCTLSGVQDRIDVFNAALPDLVDSYVKAGKKVALVAMNEAVDSSTADLQDKLHPTETGYEKMAQAWYDAIKAVDEEHDDWFTEAGEAQDPPSGTSVAGCQATPSWYNVGLIAEGPSDAYTDGDFKPAWGKKTVIAEGACPRAQLHLMDLDGDGLKDYACVNSGNGSVVVHRSKPDSDGHRTTYWEEYGMIATGASGRKGSGVKFADLNGDGRDDYIYIDSRSGSVSAWINQGKKDGTWLWEGLGVIASGVGATTTNVQFADINGDGRADFLIVDPDTKAVTGWLNTGADLIPDWHKLGVIATGTSASEDDTVFLGDFTGEGRADYMIVGEGGKVTGLVNRLQEKTLIPRWLSGITFAEGPDGVDQDEVRLVDMTGDGKVDFLQISKSKGKITMWENLGTGGKYQIGEGVFLCDLDGDGVMDYFWIDDEGGGWGYLNTGKGKDEWQALGKTAKGVGYDREHIRMARLTNSGRADYVVVGPENGLTLWWQNLGEDWDYNWKERGVAATGPRNTIETKFGWTYKSKNVRFADLNGDGLDDFLYVNDQGAVVYWKNLGTDEISWGPATLVADGVGVLAQDVQFADTNGDGLADYVVVGRVTGMSRSWHNLGFRSDGSIRWNTPLSFADGTGSAGFAIRIAEMTGDLRADYVSIDPDNGRLNLWKNRCLPSGTDDEDSDDHSNDSEPWTDRTEWEWCHLAVQDGLSPAQKSYVWGSDGAGLGVGQWLDEKIGSLEDGDLKWVNVLREENKVVINDTHFNDMDCSSLGGKCDFSDLKACEYWASKDLAHLYWIMRAVSYVSETMTTISTQLTQATVSEILNLEKIRDKFGKEEADSTALDLFSWGMSAASTATSANPGVSGFFTGLSTAASLMGILGAEDETNESLISDGALGMLYDASLQSLKAYLSLATRGYYKSSDAAIDKVSLVTTDLVGLDDSTYKTPTAQIYSGGQWLLDRSKLADNVQLWSDNFKLRARQGIIAALLRTQNWFVYIDSDIETEADCSTSGSGHEGRRWISGYCHDFWIFDYDIGGGIGDTVDTLSQSADSKSSGKLEAMQDATDQTNNTATYGAVDLNDVYKNALDCALKYPDGDGVPDLSQVDTYETYPVCFFYYPVIRGRRTSHPDGEYLIPPEDEPYINTSGRDDIDWT